MNRLWVRFSVMFATLILLGAMINIIATRQLVDRNFRPSITEERLQETGGLLMLLSEYYLESGSWEDIAPILVGAQSMSWNGPGGPTLLSLLDADQQPIYDVTWDDQINEGTLRVQNTRNYKIEVDDQIVGYLRVSQLNQTLPPPPSDADIDADTDDSSRSSSPGMGRSRERRDPPGAPPDNSPDFWPDEFSRSLILVALIGTTFSIGLSVWFSRNLTAPLEKLAEAANAIGAGDLQQRVQIRSHDEIGALATSFNNMAADLEEAETLRRNLLADVAHELRTPLTVVQGNLSALLDGVFPLENEEIARIYNQTRLLSRLVDDLRELAQAEAGQLPLHLQSVDVNELITDIASNFAGAAQSRNVELHVETAPADPAVEADPTRLRQVLHNLLGNGLRHTPDAGSVTIRASIADDQAAGDQIRIEVQDTGAGIAPDHLPHIFDRFYRADEARDRDHGGSGLGLSIARALIETHGGTLTASSTGLGEGTTFTITLPLKSTEITDPAPEGVALPT